MNSFPFFFFFNSNIEVLPRFSYLQFGCVYVELSSVVRPTPTTQRIYFQNKRKEKKGKKKTTQRINEKNI